MMGAMDAPMSSHVASVKGIAPATTIGAADEVATIDTATGHVADAGVLEDFNAPIACAASTYVCSMIVFPHRLPASGHDEGLHHVLMELVEGPGGADHNICNRPAHVPRSEIERLILRELRGVLRIGLLQDKAC